MGVHCEEAGTFFGIWRALTTFSAELEEAPLLQTFRARSQLDRSEVRFKGAIRVKAGEELKGGETIGVLPPELSPPTLVEQVVINTSTGGATILKITSAGVVSLKDALTAGQGIDFDGVTFNLK